VDKKDFLIEEALRFGWNTMKDNFWFFVGVLIVAGVITGIPHGIASAFEDSSEGLSFLFRVVGWIVDIIISIGLITIALKFLDGQKPEFKDLFAFQPHFINYLGASILTALTVIGGFILLFVPGVYWAIKFQFYGYSVVDQGSDPILAMRRSARITKTVKWKLLGFGILCALINMLGFICLIVGIFATLPTTIVAYAYVYRKLLGQTPTAQVEPAEVAKAPAKS
jgi:uncharacterized membrane protein